MRPRGAARAGRGALCVRAGGKNAKLSPPSKAGSQRVVPSVEKGFAESFQGLPRNQQVGAGVGAVVVAAALAKGVLNVKNKNDAVAAKVKAMVDATNAKKKSKLKKEKKEFTGRKRTVIITGASSGVGKNTAECLLESGHHHVVMAVRDTAKAQRVVEEQGWDEADITILELELGSLQSVKNFATEFRATGLTLDCLCCNAAVYLPNQPGPTWTEDGYEESFGVNQLGHYLLIRLLMPDLGKGDDPRCIIVGSITGNTNTVGGGAIRPLANLGELQGLRDGGKKPIAMVDGGKWDGSKAYKDSKLSNMTTILELHKRYHDDTGIKFSSLYPGCIADSPLFRQKRGWFRAGFPIFMKYVTGGYVPARSAGARLAQVCSGEECAESSGVYYSWNGRAPIAGASSPVGLGRGGEGGEIFENLPSLEVRNEVNGDALWELCEREVQSLLEVEEVEEPEAEAEADPEAEPKPELEQVEA